MTDPLAKVRAALRDGTIQPHHLKLEVLHHIETTELAERCDKRMRQCAALLRAGRGVLSAWEAGDLAAAVRALSETIAHVEADQ
jgi:hypothetical protein